MKRVKIPRENFLGTALIFFAIVGYFGRYLLNLMLANHMSAELYGDFSIAMRVLAIASSVALLGTNTSAKRFLATFLLNKDHSKISDYVKWNLRLITGSFIVVLLAVAILIIVLKVLHLFSVPVIHQYHLSVYVLWVTPVSALTLLLASYLLANHNSLLSLFFMTIGKYALMLLFFGLALLYFNIVITGTSLIYLTFASFFALMIIELYFVWKKIPILITQETLFVCRKPKEVNSYWLKVALSLMVNGVIYFILNVVDLIIIEVVSPNESAVGVYAAAVVIANVIWLIPNNAYNFIKPQITHLIHDEKGRDKLQAILDRSNKLMLVLFIAVTIIVLALSKTLLLHFGAVYIKGLYPLLIIVSGYFISGLANTSAVVLAYSGYERVTFFTFILELIVVIVLGVILTYYFDIVGTAIATTLALIMRSFIMIVFVKKKFRIRPILFF